MKPHTAAKHELLKTYLDRWFAILGLDFRGQPGRINYIDGFAGPGEYDGGEIGSPQIAIQSALAHAQKGNLPPNVEINFIFVEANPQFAANLKSRLLQLQVPSHFKVRIVEGEFADVVGSILDGLHAKGGALAPTFAFVDPFGFSGIPFELMQRILAYNKCEVYINIMVEFINRFLQHPDEDVVAHFPRTFGTEEVLQIPSQAGDRIRAILNLYKSQLASAARYVGRFDMHGRKDQHTYSLFFASNHPLGFQKMKEAHWKVDKANGGKFSDRNPCESEQQSRLFGHLHLRDQIQDQFAAKKVFMKDLETFVIQCTDYLPSHLREVLAELEAEDAIAVESVPNHKRKAGTFPSEKVHIQFR